MQIYNARVLTFVFLRVNVRADEDDLARFDGDGCKDGDQDGVQSDNRGDGKDFQSTSIDSIAVNDLGNTMTIVGSGTSGGVPVGFVLVAVESTPLTPGWVSFTFSDGYSNAGTLIDGSILLH